MDPIKINGGPSNLNRPSGRDKEEHKPTTPEATGKSGDAVSFNKKGTSLHQAFEDVVERVEAAQGERVAQIRQAIIDGTYEPDLKVVAERLLSELTGNRD